MSRPLAFASLSLAACLALVSCASSSAPSALDRLHQCSSDEGPTDAYCGTFKVFEDRQAKSGRTLDLKIVILPALSPDAKPDPLFFLAGGPGQGAAQMAAGLRDIFRRVQAERDIVLVDQRGTGKSNPLDCKFEEETLAGFNEPDVAALERLKQCLAELSTRADPRLYTTTIAMDDLDDVRAYLGYDTINVYGGSYGTRAGLVYLRQHGTHVRTIILDGNAPTDMRLPMYFPRDAQRALDRLIEDCRNDAACGAKYPNLGERTRALFARLENEPARVKLTHPRTGIAEEISVRPDLVAGVIGTALYQPVISSLVPELIVRAEASDFQGMLALAMMNDGGGGANMAIGMQLSVICAEDYPRTTAEDEKRESAGSVFAHYLMGVRMRACEFWPKGEVAGDYYQPVESSVPALVMSGDIDPVTPPFWGELVAKTLKNSRHIVAPHTGHGVISTGCGQRIVRTFVDSGTLEGLDTSCLKTMKRPPFFLTPAGPDPMPPKTGVATP
jgi:pimeloyl-ACP methyl ester carboxylesterase